MSNFYIPKYKWEYVDWFTRYYPHSKKWKWNSMTFKQLRGKYFEVRGTKRGSAISVELMGKDF